MRRAWTKDPFCDWRYRYSRLFERESDGAIGVFPANGPDTAWRPWRWWRPDDLARRVLNAWWIRRYW